MGVKLNAALGGSIELVPTNTASNYTATMPAKTGTVGMDGPAFSAYQSSAQTISSGVFTKVQFQTEEFDTNSNYDNVTNYRFTPTVAGYYQISGAVSVASAATSVYAIIYKNGVRFKDGNSNGTTQNASVVSALIYFNGTTDYVELYTYLGFGQQLAAYQYSSYFQGSLVRGA